MLYKEKLEYQKAKEYFILAIDKGDVKAKEYLDDLIVKEANLEEYKNEDNGSYN
jgi:hypothetical protein